MKVDEVVFYIISGIVLIFAIIISLPDLIGLIKDLINTILDRKDAPVKPTFDWIKIIYMVAGICNVCILYFFADRLRYQKIALVSISVYFCLHILICISAYRYRQTKKIHLTFHNILKSLAGSGLSNQLHSWIKSELESWLAKEEPYNCDSGNKETVTTQIIKKYSADNAAHILIYLQLESLLYTLSESYFVWEVEDTSPIDENNAILSNTGQNVICHMISILDELNRWVTLSRKHYLDPDFYQSQKQFLESIKETKKYKKPASTLFSRLRCTVINVPRTYY